MARPGPFDTRASCLTVIEIKTEFLSVIQTTINLSISFPVLPVMWRRYNDAHSEMYETERAWNAGICVRPPLRPRSET